MLTDLTEPRSEPRDLQGLARRHLWVHFTHMDGYASSEIPIIVRGDGCYVYDEHGKRYLDGLSTLSCVNWGHGRVQPADAAAEQARELAFFTTCSHPHPTAIELAARIAALAPDGLERVVFTSGGSEAVESAWKLARAYHRMRGENRRTKIIAREPVYHGTSMGAIAATGVPELQVLFGPLVPGACHVPTTNTYRWPDDGRGGLWTADAIQERILAEGAETVAAVILEPVQDAGGCFPPPDGYLPSVREICDRHGVLLISDEAWGRLGYHFGCERVGYVPDIITTAKGLTSAYVPMGAIIVADHVAEPFMHGSASFARLQVRRPSGRRGGSAGQPGHHRARRAVCTRSRQQGSVSRHARQPARYGDRRRRARRRLLSGDRARPGSRDGGALRRRGVRGAAARHPVAAAVSSRPDLPHRRPRRSGDPAGAAAHRRPRAVRRDRGDPGAGVDRNLGAGVAPAMLTDDLLRMTRMELDDPARQHERDWIEFWLAPRGREPAL